MQNPCCREISLTGMNCRRFRDIAISLCPSPAPERLLRSRSPVLACRVVYFRHIYVNPGPKYEHKQ
ncbi:hypothetical protein KCP71_24870 [Salmonella enterica subsp. enterica]|nr:hypothetical protein KCP71_24870 [Salmonella enterica subsp. enterica]